MPPGQKGLTDAEIAEAHRSADIFAGVKDMTSELDSFLSLLHALDWVIEDRVGKDAIRVFFDGQFGDPIQVAKGADIVEKVRAAKVEEGRGQNQARRNAETEVERAELAKKLVLEARQLAKEERFFNWQVMFPGVWSDWQEDGLHGGFDAVIGNPPWDRMKLQQVEWFAGQRPEIAKAKRAADRKEMIEGLKDNNDPLYQDFKKAEARAISALNVAKDSGDYPLLSGNDINLYSLFVEKSLLLIKRDGYVGLLTPIGIGTDKTAAKFFAQISEAKRVKAFVAFENRKGWLFPDVHHEDQPTMIIIAGIEKRYEAFDFAVKLSFLPDMKSEVIVKITSEDCRRFNPNTGTVPIFRDEKTSDLVAQIYKHHPILTDRASDQIEGTWPIKYNRMFDMTIDSKLFYNQKELEEVENAYPLKENHWRNSSGDWLPLYEGKMITLFNHRYAGVTVNPENATSQGNAVHSTATEILSPDFYPIPRFWVQEKNVNYKYPYALGFNAICNTNNYRSLISALVPRAGYGNSLPILEPKDKKGLTDLALLMANFNSIICDFVARQKIQGRNLNKYILEQLPVISPDRYQKVQFGKRTAGDIVREAVLELTYTAHDMAPFAKDMGYVDKEGKVKPPFVWDEARRLRLRAKLDAVYFHLYGITDRDDVRYIYSTFTIVEREETAAHGCYLSRDLCLAYISALAAGDPDAEIRL